MSQESELRKFGMEMQMMRLAADLTLREAAEAIYITPRELSDLEMGRAPIELVLRMAHELGVVMPGGVS